MTDIYDVMKGYCNNKDQQEEKLILAKRFLDEISISLQKEDYKGMKRIIPKIDKFMETFYSEEKWYENDYNNVKDLILWLRHGNAGRSFMRPEEIEGANRKITSAIIEDEFYIDVPKGVVMAELNESGGITPGSWCFQKCNGTDDLKVKIFKKILIPKDDLILWLRWGNNMSPFNEPVDIEDSEENVTVEVLDDMVYVDYLENTACTNLKDDGTILKENWCYMNPEKYFSHVFKYQYGMV